MKLLSKGAAIIGQGMTGSEGSRAASWMLKYGTHLVGGVTPGKGGQEVNGVPIFNSIQEALKQSSTIEASIIFVPPLRVKEAAIEAIEAGIKLLVIIAEKVPTQDTGYIYALAKSQEVSVVGPNTTGLICPSRQLKLGLMGGRC